MTAAAIATLLSADRFSESFKSANGRRIPIKGTYNHEVQKVLKKLGCKVEKTKFGEGSFAGFVKDTRHAGTFLVNVTGHYMTCSGGMIADSTFPSAIPIEQYHKGMRRVRQAWKITAPAIPRYTIDDPIVTSRAAKLKRDLKEVRAEKVELAIKKWTRRKKLAETKLKALRKQQRYYARLVSGIVRTGPAIGDHTS